MSQPSARSLTHGFRRSVVFHVDAEPTGASGAPIRLKTPPHIDEYIAPTQRKHSAPELIRGCICRDSDAIRLSRSDTSACDLILVKASAILLLIAVFVAFFVSPRTSRASIGSENPFTAEQCATAWGYAQELYARNSRDPRARLLRGEALLCIGLDDDPGALDQAVTIFDEAIGQRPLDFFAHLYRAEALHKRFFLSEETVQTFDNARRVLSEADVGAAQSYFKTYITATIEQVRRDQQAFAGLLHDGEHAFASGTASTHQIGEWLKLLAQTGPQGLRRALLTLDGYLAAHHDGLLSTFYRAELLRGLWPPAAVVSLYSAAWPVVCGKEGSVADAQACALIQKRLNRLGTTTDLEPAAHGACSAITSANENP